MYHNGRRVHVYRRNGERYADNCIVERDMFGGGGVMVWGAINYNFRSRLSVIHGNLTARRYVDEILRPELVPLVRRQHIPMLFQQDNARPHTERLTQDFLLQEGINILSWPSRSPDHNPIKHLWDVLGRRVRRRQHSPQTEAAGDSASARVGQHTSMYCETLVLFNAVQTTWMFATCRRTHSILTWLEIWLTPSVFVTMWTKTWRDRSNCFAGFKSHWIK